MTLICHMDANELQRDVPKKLHDHWELITFSTSWAVFMIGGNDGSNGLSIRHLNLPGRPWGSY